MNDDWFDKMFNVLAVVIVLLYVGMICSAVWALVQVVQWVTTK